MGAQQVEAAELAGEVLLRGDQVVQALGDAGLLLVQLGEPRVDVGERRGGEDVRAGIAVNVIVVVPAIGVGARVNRAVARA